MNIKKTAVILLNLGGPNNKKAIRHFLFNLFNDKFIINLPQPFRFLLAKFISITRHNFAAENYDKIGGKSPILKEVKEQAYALEKALNANSNSREFKVFILMRYWHPFAQETAELTKEYNPDNIILLPLYPQFSKTTTYSGLCEWKKAATKLDLNVSTRTICCYPILNELVMFYADQIKNVITNQNIEISKAKLLFSAHGLPVKKIKEGDPYQKHVIKSANAIVEKLNLKDLKTEICYQSKVGPLKWLEPSLETSIRNAKKERFNSVIVLPISFTSEHVETLVELDIEYKEIANHVGIQYHRIQTTRASDLFISGLAKLCIDKSYNDSNFGCNAKCDF